MEFGHVGELKENNKNYYTIGMHFSLPLIKNHLNVFHSSYFSLSSKFSLNMNVVRGLGKTPFHRLTVIISTC